EAILILFVPHVLAAKGALQRKTGWRAGLPVLERMEVLEGARADRRPALGRQPQQAAGMDIALHSENRRIIGEPHGGRHGLEEDFQFLRSLAQRSLGVVAVGPR